MLGQGYTLVGVGASLSVDGNRTYTYAFWGARTGAGGGGGGSGSNTGGGSGGAGGTGGQTDQGVAGGLQTGHRAPGAFELLGLERIYNDHSIVVARFMVGPYTFFVDDAAIIERYHASNGNLDLDEFKDAMSRWASGSALVARVRTSHMAFGFYFDSRMVIELERRAIPLEEAVRILFGD